MEVSSKKAGVKVAAIKGFEMSMNTQNIVKI